MLVFCSKEKKKYSDKNQVEEFSRIEKEFAEGEAYFKEKKGRLYRSLRNVLFLNPSSSTHYQKAKTMIETAVHQYEDYGIGPGDIERIVNKYPDIWVDPDILYNLATVIIKPDYEEEIDSRRRDSIQDAVKLLTHLLNKYTEYDNEPFVYFSLAKGFLDLKKALEAKQYFIMLINKFPDSEYVGLAKKFLSEIPKLQKYGYVGDFGEKAFGGEGEFGYIDKGIGHGWFKRNPIVDIELDNQRNVYIADKINKRIVKYNSKGDFIWQTQRSILPLDIETDQDGNLYIVEGPTTEILYELPDQLHSISKYTPQGEILLHFAFPERSNPYAGAAAFDENGQIILIDKYFKRFWIKQFDNNLRVTRKAAFEITHPGPFKVCLGDSGYIYVVKGYHLTKMSSSYDSLWTVILPTAHKWPSQSKIFITYNKTNQVVYVIFHAARDEDKSQIFIVNSNGIIQETQIYDAKPYIYIISNADGECFKAMYDSSSIRIFDMSDSLIVMLDGSSTTKGQFLVPSHIELINNDLCVYDKYLKKKTIYDKNGHFLHEKALESSDPVKETYPEVKFKEADEHMNVEDFTRDQSGKMYFLFSSPGYCAIQIFNQSGKFLKEINLPASASIVNYKQIAVSNDNYIYVACNIGKIIIIDYEGHQIDEFGHGAFTAEPVDCLCGMGQIVIDSDKNVYAIDAFSNSIKKFVLVK